MPPMMRKVLNLENPRDDEEVRKGEPEEKSLDKVGSARF